MKKTLFILCLLSSVVALAQINPIIVQNGNTLRYASSWDSAVIIATGGDTIYLPAGVFAAPTTFNKKLAILGVGYRTDSSRYSGTTIITGNLTIGTSGSNSFLTGLNIVDQLTLSSVSGVNIANCKIQGLQVHLLNANNLLRECIIGTIPYYGSFWQRYTIQNSIIENSIDLYYVTVVNSIFLNANSGLLFSSSRGTRSQAYLTNNIILLNNSNSTYAFDNTVFLHNNLIVGGSNYGIDTIQNIYRPASFRSTVFLRFNGTAHNELSDYHTQSACTECVGQGIYNGSFPFRPLPNTPIVLEKEVSSSTNNNYLRFKIKLRLPTN
jgi:hypothetical protein